MHRLFVARRVAAVGRHLDALKALQVASKHGWNFAKHLELTNRHDVNVVSNEEMAEAARIAVQQKKLSDSIGLAAARTKGS